MIRTAATPKHTTRHCWQGLHALLFAFLSLLTTFAAAAEPADTDTTSSPFRYPVLVAGSDNTAFNLRFIDLLRQELGDNVQIMAFSPAGAAEYPESPVISLGNSALARAQQSADRPPTLALMVTAEQFSHYLDRDNKTVSAVYYDTPLVRQALLGKLILPQASRVALLAQQGYENRYDDLIQQLAGYDLKARVFTVRDEESLISTLSRALSYGDFLLAVPDPVIFNPQTIKHILLTAYRKNRVVIGPGRAFVRAGVLASTFPPLEAIAGSAAQQITHYQQFGEFLPAFYPTEFGVEINHQVANSLNVPIPDEDTLKDQLQQLLQAADQGGRP